MEPFTTVTNIRFVDFTCTSTQILKIFLKLCAIIKYTSNDTDAVHGLKGALYLHHLWYQFYFCSALRLFAWIDASLCLVWKTLRVSNFPIHTKAICFLWVFSCRKGSVHVDILSRYFSSLYLYHFHPHICHGFHPTVCLNSCIHLHLHLSHVPRVFLRSCCCQMRPWPILTFTFANYP